MAKSNEKKDDDSQAVVLRRFLRNGVTYDPAGPNDRCADFETGDDPKTREPKDEAFRGPNPLLILPSKLRGLTVSEALEKQIQVKTILELEQRAEDAEKGQAAAEGKLHEVELELQAVQQKNEQLVAENRNLTAKLSKGPDAPAA